MALGDIVQVGNRVGSGGASSFAPTLTSTATSGNLLVAYGCITVGSRTATTPTGWTAGPALDTGTNHSCHTFWKESDGTETGVTISLSGSGGGYYNIIEIDATGLDLSSIGASAEDESNENTAVSSQSTGTANNASTTGVAVAFFGFDIGGNVNGGRAYTNSFTEQDTSDTGNTSRGGYYLASKTITATSNECTYSNTEGSEEAYGAILVFEAAAGGDTNVNANTEALTITENQATVALDVNISAATEALTITEYQASVALGVNVNANTEALTITENAASITLDVDVQANTEALTITEYQATIDAGGATNVVCSTEALTITTQAASVAVDVNVNAATEALTITTNAASILTGETTLTAQDIQNIVDAIFAHVVENSETFAEQLKLIRAEAAGKLLVSGTTVTIRDAADSKDRITATVDNNGQRTAVTTDVI